MIRSKMIQNVNFIWFGWNPLGMILFQNFDNDLISRLPAEGSQTNLDIKLVSKISIFDQKLNFQGSFFENFAVKKWNFLKNWTW